MSDETLTIPPALTPEEWARDANAWMAERCAGGEIPRHALAALCLHGMPFGFTREDVDALREVSFRVESWDRELLARYEGVIAKLRALLPPEG